MTGPADSAAAPPSRFYGTAAVAAGEAGIFAVTLDGRNAKTRARNPLTTGSRSLAEAMAAEWAGQEKTVNFLAMPMTRFRMTVIDRSGADVESWKRATLAFLASDLLCYRAAAPRALVDRQASAWDPLLRWAAAQGIELTAGEGVAFIVQPPRSLEAAAALLGAASADELISIKAAAEITGSAVVALALWRRAWPAEALFEAARTDEDFQAEQWGRDAEAEARARRLKQDFLDADRYLSLISAG